MINVKREARDAISVKSRLALFHGTRLSASEALSIPEENITYSLFLELGIKPANFLAAGIGPCELKARGVEAASNAKLLGFDSLHVTNPFFCNQLMMAYGRDEAVAAFLSTPTDAVNLAGSEAVNILKIKTHELLQATIGSPKHAVAVLQQLPPGKSLAGVKAQLLLDSGLRLKTLAACGYTLDTLLETTDVSPAQLEKLGFSI